MGNIIRTSAREVLPYQRRFLWDTLAELLPIFEEGRYDTLFPCAAGNFPGRRVIINGHHRFLLADLFGVNLPVYLVESKSDLMRRDEFPQYDERYLWDVNIVISFSYETVEECARRMKTGVYKTETFADLRRGIDVTDLESLKRRLADDKKGNFVTACVIS